MDAFFGECDGLEAFGRAIYEGRQHFIPLPPGRWQGIEDQPEILKAYGFEDGQAPQGAYITDFDMDFLHFKIPPNDDRPIPQQLLILKVADRALRDAGLEEGGNVAVIIASGAELALHRFRSRCDLAWQVEESLAQSDVNLSPEQANELERIAKNSIHEASQVNQYTSFIGNIMASRISSQWDFSGPSFTLSAEENSVFKALETAQMFLAAGEVDAVVVGAVDLAGGLENVLLRNQSARVNSGAQTMSVDQNANGWLIGEGAGAVVLKRREDAVQSKDRIYAVIDAISIVQDRETGRQGDKETELHSITTSETEFRQQVRSQSCAQDKPGDWERGGQSKIVNRQSAIERVFAETGLAPADIGYLELFGSGISREDEAEIKGLTAAYQTQASELSCAIGSVKANIGHTYTASGMASLIKTAHCLYHRYIPAVPQWSTPKMPEVWQNSPFYAPTESRPWFSEQGRGGAGERGRIAAINGLGVDGSSAHLILSDEASQQPRDNACLSHSSPSAGQAQSSFYLFPLAADEPEALLEALQTLRQHIKSASSLPDAARQSFGDYQKRPDAAYAIAILGRDKKKLLQEIQVALSGAGRAIEKGEAWKTPPGSYFTPKPLGKTGKVAFVYPGAFSSYPGLGRDLFHLFPELHRSFTEQIPNPGELVGEKTLYPRSLNRLSKRELKKLTAKLMSDPITMLQSGATFSTLVTTILRNQFKVQPQAALGYSLGEMTMMFALGVWSLRDNNSAHLRKSSLFRDRLSGPQNAVREYWAGERGSGGAREQGDKEKDLQPSDIWAIFVLKASPDSVKVALAQEERVYLTHINTPGEVVIAGDPRACQRVIKALNCGYMQAPYNHVIHSKAMRSEYDEFVKLNTLPVANTPALDFYFTADDKPQNALNSQTIARNIASAAVQQLDFPRLVQRAYRDGARIFIELGPGSACTLWIGDILKEEAHLAAAIDRRRLNDRTSLVKLLAQLVSHRAPLDISPLYAPRQEDVSKKRSLVRSVSLAGKRIQDVILTEENRQKFNNLPRKAPPPPAQMADAIKTPPFAIVNGKAKSSAPVLDESDGEENNQASIIPLKAKDIPMTDTFSEPVAAQPAKVLEALEDFSLDFFDRHLQKLSENATRTCQAHSAFLRARQKGLQQTTELMQLQLDLPTADRRPPTAVASPIIAEAVDSQNRKSKIVNPKSAYSQPKNVIWDETDLLNYAEGDIAPIFGEEYAIIDTYRRRVRLPMPPYLLVSRITKLQAQRGVYEASTMTTEYDIPFDAWYSTDGQIPWAVSVESGQCDLMLISYLGIDFENKGERVYRLLDCTLTFLEDMPLEGHTLRYDISIDSFAKSGDSLLFFFSYNCFVGDTMVLKMRGGCAGFFSDEELAAGKGIITSQREKDEKLKIPKQHFRPLLPQGPKTSFNRAELLSLSQGDIAAVFGPQYDQTGLNPSLRLPPEGILMVDRIVSVDPSGGAWGLGLIVSEKDLEPDHWYFPCHFKGDQVMAGSLVAEGCSQLLQFYLLYLGFQSKTQDARFQPMPNLPQVVRTRKQIMACSSKLTYRMEITEIGLSPQPYAKANVDIIFEGVVVVDFKNLGLQLTEKPADDPWKLHNAEVLRNTEKVARQQTKDEGRKTKSVFTSDSSSVLRPSSVISSSSPALFNEDHIQEFAMGSISKCFGPDYEVFEGRRIPRTPNGDLKLISRIVEINARRFGFTGEPNLISEYDVPASAWFYHQNNYPVMPYSILMEIALQPCGFLSAWLGSTLAVPEENFYFRNLDGDGFMLKEIDTRGKTIVNRVKLLSSTAIRGIIIQKFAYQLECEGEAFYEGSAVFGYFQPQSLANQVGLDRGQSVKPWFEQEDVSGLPVARIDLPSPAAQKQWYQSLADKPFYRLAGEQLNFLDEAIIIPGGGRHQRGYIYAAKAVDPQDWFFSCHFYQDPVMPGSLGVEAILQAMQLYALHQNLGAHLKSPYFSHLSDHKITWMYRGQIIPDNDKMALEIHISNVESSHNQVTLVGDASLWKDDMRIYEVKGIAIRLLSSAS